MITISVTITDFNIERYVEQFKLQHGIEPTQVQIVNFFQKIGNDGVSFVTESTGLFNELVAECNT